MLTRERERERERQRERERETERERERESKVEKLVLRYVRTKWIAPNKCWGIFLVHWYDQVR